MTCNLICSNGVINSPEACDDGNLTPNDGCDASCSSIDYGYTCPTPGSSCITNCGDGLKANTENCDDGNTTPNDGCTTCNQDIGYNCPTENTLCIEVCGDSRVVGSENCDNGASAGTSGCQAGCKTDALPTWTCLGGDVTTPSTCF
jgi:cysteine-rich repeat protein